MPTENQSADTFWIAIDPPNDAERLGYAGDDPKRRAAIARWLALDQRDMIPDKRGRQLREICFRGPKVHDEHLRDLVLFPELTDVGLIGTSVTDAGLEILLQLPSVEVIGVNDSPRITNAACKTLGCLTNLVVLDLSKSRIGDDGVAALRGLRNLSRIMLGDTKVTSASLGHVAVLPKLEWLCIERTRIGDDGLRYLRNCKRLYALAIHETVVTDAGVAHLAGLKRMWQLLLRDTQIGDGSLRVAGGFPKLHTLDVQNTGVTSEGVADLVHLEKLQNLWLDATAIDDGCVDHLVKMQSIVMVSLKRTKVSLRGIERLRAALKTQKIYSDFGLPKR